MDQYGTAVLYKKAPPAYYRVSFICQPGRRLNATKSASKWLDNFPVPATMPCKSLITRHFHLYHRRYLLASKLCYNYGLNYKFDCSAISLNCIFQLLAI